MKGLLKFITCGSVDDGKSTLIGHILYDAKLIYADQEKALELDSKVGSREGEIDYSLLLDGLMAEREQGITIDVAYRYFTTDNRSFIVADTPGHEEYTRNMAVGASFAELAVILIDASQGVLVQTRRHARICKLMGIRHFVFAVNKMDLADYSQERFGEIEGQIGKLKSELHLHDIKVIPLSATAGDNVTVHSERMPWYRGETLLEYLERVEIKDDDEQGFYLPVQRVCRPNHTFRGFQGQVESGKVSVGDELTILPGREKVRVKELLVGDRQSGSAEKGQPVTICLDREVDVSRGSVLVSGTDLAVYKRLTVSLLWMSDDELKVGEEYLIKLGTKTITGVVSEVKYSIDVNSGEKLRGQTVGKNVLAVVDIVTSEPVPADKFEYHRTLGELILIDRVTNMTSACGVVKELHEKSGEFSNRASFSFNGLEARGDIFEEFCYSPESFGVLKYRTVGRTYTVGDRIPVKGESYHYPDSFDIIVLRDSVSVEIRDSIITAIRPLDEYVYTGQPVVNGRGFEALVDSAESFSEFIGEYRKTDGSHKFFEKWLRFGTYRNIIFGK
ncbi:sulfate adenylyltransferase subunit 1 [Ruminococcus sp. YE71]|uniref:sulfate adenylyltransferase subunit 1 n=1 Tax=unclassified Ruminococcus TaxID=2608920 RepID=UPI00087EFD46|nr:MULTISPECIES: GTP-binding protein [unclassified Ruminococcus]SDA13278.1 sulfate adenylyltransferase subunit 1 [Ruminococcus sp. YE78]SFW18766.1 sulfate adenylyltransferase subunit 1 [Ruminococcus sp. YE71]